MHDRLAGRTRPRAQRMPERSGTCVRDAYRWALAGPDAAGARDGTDARRGRHRRSDPARRGGRVARGAWTGPPALVPLPVTLSRGDVPRASTTGVARLDTGAERCNV